MVPQAMSTEESRPQASQTPRPAGRWWWRGVAAIGGGVVVLVMAEIVVRIFGLGPQPFSPRRFEPHGAIPFMTIPNGPIAYQPNVTFASVYDLAGDTRGYLGPTGRVPYHINSYGLRGPEIPVKKQPGSYRVVCLGDSLTFGEGVKYADTYPAQLQARLAAAMPDRLVEVLNAGVQTHATGDEAALFLLRCSQFQPDLVVLGFYLNDATDVRQTVHQNDQWTKSWDSSALSRVSRLWDIFARVRRARQLQDEFLEATRAGFDSARWSDCKTILRGMEKISREDGFRFVIVVFPVFWQLDGGYPFAEIHTKIAAFCDQAGIECVDLLETYRNRPSQSLWVHPTDRHPNEIAHHLAAKRIASYLLTAVIK